MSMPTINVNLTKCAEWCRHSLQYVSGADHSLHCPAALVLVPLPIPRSATFKVRLGECMCRNIVENGVAMRGEHHGACPAHPVSVSCSITGKAWANSFVDDIDPEGRNEATMATIRDACDARWTIVKALMLGRATTLADILAEPMSTVHMTGLLSQRNAVFRAIAGMARAEDAAQSASIDLYIALSAADPQRQQVTNPGNYALSWSDGHPNAEAGLAAYLEILMEQVQVLE